MYGLKCQSAGEQDGLFITGKRDHTTEIKKKKHVMNSK